MSEFIKTINKIVVPEIDAKLTDVLSYLNDGIDTVNQDVQENIESSLMMDGCGFIKNTGPIDLKNSSDLEIIDSDGYVALCFDNDLAALNYKVAFNDVKVGPYHVKTENIPLLELTEDDDLENLLNHWLFFIEIYETINKTEEIYTSVNGLNVLKPIIQRTWNVKVSKYICDPDDDSDIEYCFDYENFAEWDTEKEHKLVLKKTGNYGGVFCLSDSDLENYNESAPGESNVKLTYKICLGMFSGVVENVNGTDKYKLIKEPVIGNGFILDGMRTNSMINKEDGISIDNIKELTYSEYEGCFVPLSTEIKRVEGLKINKNVIERKTLDPIDNILKTDGERKIIETNRSVLYGYQNTSYTYRVVYLDDFCENYTVTQLKSDLSTGVSNHYSIDFSVNGFTGSGTGFGSTIITSSQATSLVKNGDVFVYWVDNSNLYYSIGCFNQITNSYRPLVSSAYGYSNLNSCISASTYGWRVSSSTIPGNNITITRTNTLTSITTIPFDMPGIAVGIYIYFKGNEIICSEVLKNKSNTLEIRDVFTGKKLYEYSLNSNGIVFDKKGNSVGIWDKTVIYVNLRDAWYINNNTILIETKKDHGKTIILSPEVNFCIRTPENISIQLDKIDVKNINSNGFYVEQMDDDGDSPFTNCYLKNINFIETEYATYSDSDVNNDSFFDLPKYEINENYAYLAGNTSTIWSPPIGDTLFMMFNGSPNDRNNWIKMTRYNSYIYLSDDFGKDVVIYYIIISPTQTVFRILVTKQGLEQLRNREIFTDDTDFVQLVYNKRSNKYIDTDNIITTDNFTSLLQTKLSDLVGSETFNGTISNTSTPIGCIRLCTYKGTEADTLNIGSTVQGSLLKQTKFKPTSSSTPTIRADNMATTAGVTYSGTWKVLSFMTLVQTTGDNPITYRIGFFMRVS